MKKPFQKQTIKSSLESSGWRLISKETPSDWWIDELWTLESVWSPVGLKLFITFEVTGGEIEEVWDAAASFSGACGSGDVDSIASFNLASKWEKELPSSIKAINDARGEVSRG